MCQLCPEIVAYRVDANKNLIPIYEEGWEDDETADEIEERMARLSRREREVMGHVIAGRLNKQIAADLNISLKTVKAHRAKVMAKMDVRSVPALVDLCRAAGVGAPERIT